jgi:hypothetical protein
MILTFQNLSFLRHVPQGVRVPGALPNPAGHNVSLSSCRSTDSDRWSFFVAFKKNDTSLC